VTVTEDGFMLGRHRYRSLSAVARAITGKHWNGFIFFDLERSTCSGPQTPRGNSSAVGFASKERAASANASAAS
jgi:hypothetical protein